MHFNITLGRPVSDIKKVKSLVDQNGDFHSRGVLSRRFLLGQIKTKELELELQSQFERMVSHGMSPTHIDSHQHVHAFPLCFDSVAALCHRIGIPMRMPWVLHVKGVQVPVSRNIRQYVLKGLLSRNRKRWNGLVDWNSGLGSIFDLGTVPEGLDIDHYRLLLESAPVGVFELMVHPARDAGQLEGKTGIGDISEREWRFLMSDSLRPLISELGFTLGNYKSL